MSKRLDIGGVQDYQALVVFCPNTYITSRRGRFGIGRGLDLIEPQFFLPQPQHVDDIMHSIAIKAFQWVNLALFCFFSLPP